MDVTREPKEFCTNCPSYLHEKNICYLRIKEKGKLNSLLKQCFSKRTQESLTLLSDLYLQEADLRNIRLQAVVFQYSDFRNAKLQGAYLNRVIVESSIFEGANLESVILEKVDFRRIENMRNARFFNIIDLAVLLPPISSLGAICVYETEKSWDKAEYVYRQQKELYKNQGQYNESGHFFEREMEMQRQQSRGFNWLSMTVMYLTCGHGERPIRTIIFAFVLIMVFALAYFFLPLIGPNGVIQYDIGIALYFSTITFTTLGYGDIRPEGIARFLAAAEALVGAFTVALFVFVFCRRMLR